MSKSAIRRFHRDRIIAKFVRNELRYNPAPHSDNYARWLFVASRKFAAGTHGCSCYMCKGAREKYGNGRWARTIAEQHAIEDLKYFNKHGGS